MKGKKDLFSDKYCADVKCVKLGNIAISALLSPRTVLIVKIVTFLPAKGPRAQPHAPSQHPTDDQAGQRALQRLLLQGQDRVPLRHHPGRR